MLFRMRIQPFLLHRPTKIKVLKTVVHNERDDEVGILQHRGEEEDMTDMYVGEARRMVWEGVFRETRSVLVCRRDAGNFHEIAPPVKTVNHRGTLTRVLGS